MKVLAWILIILIAIAFFIFYKREVIDPVNKEQKAKDDDEIDFDC